MKHIPRSILIALSRGDLTRDQAREAQAHVAGCPRCAGEQAFISRIVSPSADKEKSVPSRKALRRVLATYDTVTRSRRGFSRLLDVASLRLRYTIVSSGVVALLFLAGFLYIEWKYEYRPVQASHVSGDVKANRANMHKGQALKAGDHVITGEDSRLALVLGKLMKLNAGPGTSMYITKSYLNRKTGKTTVEIVVKKGTILAVFDKTGKMKFIFKTPHGSISSQGSNIALEVRPEKTRIVVKEGIAKLAPSRGSSIQSSANQAYSITTREVLSLEENPDDEDDITALSKDDIDEADDSSGDSHSIR